MDTRVRLQEIEALEWHKAIPASTIAMFSPAGRNRFGAGSGMSAAAPTPEANTG